MPPITEWLRREDRREDLFAFFSFRVSPPTSMPPFEAQSMENRAFGRLVEVEPTSSTPEARLTAQLEARLMEHLVNRLDIPLKVSVFFRRGSFKIVALALVAYTVLKDYKTLRDSLSTLRNDVVRPFVTED